MIERDQIFVSIIAQGPDGAHLSSAFDRRLVFVFLAYDYFLTGRFAALRNE